MCVWGVSHFLSAQAVRVWTRTSILDPGTIVTVGTVWLVPLAMNTHWHWAGSRGVRAQTGGMRGNWKLALVSMERWGKRPKTKACDYRKKQLSTAGMGTIQPSSILVMTAHGVSLGWKWHDWSTKVIIENTALWWRTLDFFFHWCIHTCGEASVRWSAW